MSLIFRAVPSSILTFCWKSRKKNMSKFHLIWPHWSDFCGHLAQRDWTGIRGNANPAFCLNICQFVRYPRLPWRISWTVPSENASFQDISLNMWVCLYTLCDCRHFLLVWGCLWATKRGGSFLALILGTETTQQTMPSSYGSMWSSFRPYDFHRQMFENFQCAVSEFYSYKTAEAFTVHAEMPHFQSKCQWFV